MEWKICYTVLTIFCICFGAEHIPKSIKKLIGKKFITTNIFRVQACDSIMRGYFYPRFFNFMLKGISFSEDTNLFSPNKHEKNDKIILKYFK